VSDDNRVEKVLKGANAVVEAATGIGFIDGMAGFLRDPKAPAPVIPPDLHLVKPVTADADGNVTCIYCGARVAWSAAEMVGSHGFSCGRHVPAALSPDTKIPRRVWPLALAIAAAIVVVVAFAVWLYQRGEPERASPSSYSVF
jgi:hypothetical protein